LKNLEISEGSSISFYKNGVKQSQEFVDIFEADYFAAVSMYMNAKVSINFGQSKFKYFNSISKAQPKSALNIMPYYSLSKIDNLEKYGVFKIKPEKIEDY